MVTRQANGSELYPSPKRETLRLAGKTDTGRQPPEKGRHGFAIGSMDAKNAAGAGVRDFVST